MPSYWCIVQANVREVVFLHVAYEAHTYWRKPQTWFTERKRKLGIGTSVFFVFSSIHFLIFFSQALDSNQAHNSASYQVKVMNKTIQDHYNLASGRGTDEGHINTRWADVLLQGMVQVYYYFLILLPFSLSPKYHLSHANNFIHHSL